MSKSWHILIISATAILLVAIVLMFISFNPWLLLGVPAVLMPIAAIIHAIATHAQDDDEKQ